MSFHHRYSPSASKGWMACAGRLNLTDGMPEGDKGHYAAEGTAAHTLCETAISEGKQPFDYLGINIDGFEVDADMIQACTVYTDYVRSLKGEWTFLEETFELEEIDKDLGGTADAIVACTKTKVLNVIDYKHGAGIAVYPDNNPQLMIYALGALKAMSHNSLNIDTVNMAIVQPRTPDDSPIRNWAITKEALLQWRDAVLIPSIARTKQPNAPLCAGDHCRFCKAMAICPEQTKKAIAVAQTDFAAPTFTAPEEMPAHDIAKVLEFAEMFGAWVKSVSAYAKLQLDGGQEVKGYKLVARRANRAWGDKKAAEDNLKNYLGNGAYNHSLLTPPQAEKALKAFGLDPKLTIGAYIVKPDTGSVMAKESDKRPAIKASVVSDFLSTAEFLT